MDGYIANLLLNYCHKAPTKPQLSPHHHREINYSAKEKLLAEEDTRPKLNNGGIKHVQAIIGALFYYVWAVHNILLVDLSAIGAEQAAATEQNKVVIDQILDYVATYANDRITYRSIEMILAAHFDTESNNESTARSCSGAHIYIFRKRPNARVERTYPHNCPDH